MNLINVIAPYKHLDMWVFDDPQAGLHHQPFIRSADTMIDRAVEDIPKAANGFVMLFSSSPFPGNTLHLKWRRAESGGNWYYSEVLGMEGWLSPALSAYFPEAPRELYVQVKEKTV